MAPRHRDALGDGFERVARQGAVEVLEPWTNPGTGRPAAVSNDRLARLRDELLPVAVAGGPVQYAVNRLPDGWVVELVNNAGAAKKPDQPAVTDPAAVACVTLTPRTPWASATEWRSGKTHPAAEPITLELGPGATAFIELTAPGK